MENDNSGIESAANAGNFEGSVSADAPGNASTIESNMSAENGGGFSNGGPQVGSLDLDSATIGAPIAIMDNRVDNPAPSFVANMTSADIRGIGSTIALGAASVAAILTVSPSAGPLLATTIFTGSGNLEGLARAAADAQLAMGRPGAFIADVMHNTTIGDPLVNTGQVDTPYWSAWGWSSFDQYMGFAPDSGGGGGGGSG